MKFYSKRKYWRIKIIKRKNRMQKSSNLAHSSYKTLLFLGTIVTFCISLACRFHPKVYKFAQQRRANKLHNVFGYVLVVVVFNKYTFRFQFSLAYICFIIQLLLVSAVLVCVIVMDKEHCFFCCCRFK